MLLSQVLLLLLLLSAEGWCGQGRRHKRTFSWLFPAEESRPNLPIYRVHRYSGIHLQPLVPGGKRPLHGDLPELQGPPPDVLELPEGEGYGEDQSGIGALVGLLPYTGGLVSSALGLAGGSSGGGNNEINRIGLAAKASAKKDLFLSFKQAKKDVLSSVASSAVNKAIAKGQATTNVVKSILKGNAKTEKFSGGVYHYVPVIYPKRQGLLSKIPFVGKFLGYGSPIDVPEVLLPYLPQLYSVPDTPNLPHINLPVKYDFPYKTGYYVKVKVPKIGNYDIPGTSYGVPGRPVAVPEAPEYVPPSPPEIEEEFTPETPEVLEPPTTANYPFPPEVPKEPSYPYQPEAPSGPSYPYPPEAPNGPSYPYPPEAPSGPSYPYPAESPQESFPYPPSDVPSYIPPPPPLPEEPQYVPPVQNYPYPSYTGYYQATAGSEKHEVVAAKPGDDRRPIYRHKEEAEVEKRTDPIHVVLPEEVAEPAKENTENIEVKELKEDPPKEEDSVKS